MVSRRLREVGKEGCPEGHPSLAQASPARHSDAAGLLTEKATKRGEPCRAPFQGKAAFQANNDNNGKNR